MLSVPGLICNGLQISESTVDSDTPSLKLRAKNRVRISHKLPNLKLSAAVTY